MIFKIDDSIRNVPKSQYVDLARAIIEASLHLHYLLFDNYQTQRWLCDTVLNSTDYVAKLESEQLMQNIEFWKPTTINKRYLQIVIVGDGEQFCNVSQMLKLAEMPGAVVVENELYDWSVIKKWISLYATNEYGYFQTINRAVNTAVMTARLVGHGAGGGDGTIRNTIMALMPIYGKLLTFKLTTIFDSDKDSNADSSHNEGLIKFLIEYNLLWKELKRREIENYFPLSSYKKAGLIVDIHKNSALSSSDWEFVDFGKKDESGVKMQKSDILQLTNDLTYKELKEVLKPSNGNLDEVQEIILHLAKYI